VKPIIVIPTYNERENICDLIKIITQESPPPDLDLLVVDSASPDQTSGAVGEMQKKIAGLHLLTQPAKLGLGRAYLEGMRWALDRSYDCLITMDADFSHHPSYLKEFLGKLKTYDLVIGSRYVPGGRLENWPWHRRALSKFANGYAKTLTGLPFSDLTSGFHGFRTPLLKKILNHPIHAEGYAFLIELKHLAILERASFLEIPIIFSDRARGSSKISKRVIFESMLFVGSLFFRRMCCASR